MAAKQLQKDSKFAPFDVDSDGVVTDEEMHRAQEMMDIENKDAKEDQLRKMAWAAMGSMIIVTLAVCTPFVEIARITALGSVLQMFYLAQAGVVATFFGASAYVSK